MLATSWLKARPKNKISIAGPMPALHRQRNNKVELRRSGPPSTVTFSSVQPLDLFACARCGAIPTTCNRLGVNCPHCPRKGKRGEEGYTPGVPHCVGCHTNPRNKLGSYAEQYLQLADDMIETGHVIGWVGHDYRPVMVNMLTTDMRGGAAGTAKLDWMPCKLHRAFLAGVPLVDLVRHYL
jgi:hypothetical protein